MKSFKNKKDIIGLVLILFAFFTIGIFTIKAQEQQSEDKEFQLLQRLVDRAGQMTNRFYFARARIFNGSDGITGSLSHMHLGSGDEFDNPRSLLQLISNKGGIDDLLTIITATQTLGLSNEYAKTAYLDMKEILDQEIIQFLGPVENDVNTFTSNVRDLRNLLQTQGQQSQAIKRLFSTTKSNFYKTMSFNSNELPGQVDLLIKEITALSQYMENVKKFNEEHCLKYTDETTCANLTEDVDKSISMLDYASDHLLANSSEIQNISAGFNQLETQPVSILEGDLTGDGKVDIFDLVTVAKNFGKKLE